MFQFHNQLSKLMSIFEVPIEEYSFCFQICLYSKQQRVVYKPKRGTSGGSDQTKHKIGIKIATCQKYYSNLLCSMKQTSNNTTLINRFC